MLDALLFAKTPKLLTAVYPDCLWKVNTQGKKLYLTFDDGPIPEVTPFVLDELKKWNAKATFFCIGKNMVANPGIYKRIIEEGHSTGNHTYDHLNGWNTSDEQYFENIDKCELILLNLLRTSDFGLRTLFRPPYGKLKPSQYSKLKSKYRIVMWDVLSYDFDVNLSREKVLDNILKNADPGSIIVMHDSLKAKPKVEYALPLILEHFTALEYTFEKL
ncbi:MAG TPA: polysaccharide deacetylase family protein [Chitinophagales bacterium]|nr:polysaccharide deacetylase family protein [Chitinophagales bacterium]